MLRIRESRAFTMIELIVVIVILGILAAIAAVSYNAVIDRSKKSGLEQSARQVGKQYAALGAFDQKSGKDAAVGALKVGATTVAVAGEEINADLGGSTKAYVGKTAGQLTIANENGFVCLTLGTTLADAGSVVANSFVKGGTPAATTC